MPLNNLAFTVVFAGLLIAAGLAPWARARWGRYRGRHERVLARRTGRAVRDKGGVPMPTLAQLYPGDDLAREHFRCTNPIHVRRLTAPLPTACPVCDGDGVVGTVTQSWCPACTCVYCGQPTLTPPECEGGCDVLEDAQAKRRADV